jgi:hypothetical protein
MRNSRPQCSPLLPAHHYIIEQRGLGYARFFAAVWTGVRCLIHSAGLTSPTLRINGGRGDPRNLSLVRFRGTTDIEESLHETHSDSGSHSRIDASC